MSGGDCPHMRGCEMYQLFSLAGTLRTWQVRYCQAEFQTCARFQRSAQGRSVPINLMPNGALLKKPDRT